MEYQCQAIAIDKMPIGPIGPAKSLCDSCNTVDCTNPIEFRKTSVLGISRKMRLWVQANDVKIVIECAGFSS